MVCYIPIFVKMGEKEAMGQRHRLGPQRGLGSPKPTQQGGLSASWAELTGERDGG